MSNRTLRVLIVEDSEDDALLLIRELKKGGYNPVYERVETSAAMKKALKKKQWDIILCDYTLPKFNARSALAILKEANIDIPIIIVSGTIGEETAIECMRLGAQDYIMKSNLSRLGPAIARELKEAEVRNKQKQAEEERRFRDILLATQQEVSIDGILVVDENNRILLYNRRFIELWKLPAKLVEDRIDEPVLQFVTAQMADPRSFLQRVQYLYEHRQETSRDELVLADGRFFDRYSAPMVGSDKRYFGRIWYFRDITERKRTEDQLQESEKKYKLITEKINDIVWIADMNLQIQYVTPSVSKVLGFSLEAIYGTIKKQMTLESLAIVMEALARELAVEKRVDGNPNRTINLVLEFYHKDGSTRWLETIISGLRDEEGVLTGIHGVSRDITERKLIEFERETALKSLQKSEELFTKLMITIPDIIVLTDLEGNIMFANENTLPIFGYKREEIEGQNVLKFVAPRDQEVAKKNLKLLLNSRLTPMEFNLLAKDRREIPFEINGDVLRKEDGTPFAIVHVCRNISERKQSEKLLRERDERLYGITQNLPGIIFQFYAKDTGEYGVSYVSQPVDEFSKIIVGDAAANLDTFFPSFVSRVYEGDRDRFLVSIKTAVDEISPWNFEGRIVTQSDEMVWFQGISIPTRYEDQLVFDGILLNITERNLAEEKSRQSEEKFRNIFMTTPNCITISRLSDGIIKDVNRGFEDIVGWKREDVIGFKSTEPPLNLWVDLSERNFMVEESKSGRDVLNRQFEFRRRDGSIRTGIYSARPINIDGEAAVIFILQDITEQKRAENELKLFAENLEDANIALRVLMNRRDKDQKEFEEKLQININDLVIPYLKKLKMGNLDDRNKNYVNVLEKNLSDVLSPFMRDIQSLHKKLTPQEIQIVDLIRQGKNTKEIADMLNASVNTIATHRDNIRKKMNLKNSKINLRSHILSLK